MTDYAYFTTRLNKLNAESVKAKSSDKGIEIFVIKPISKVLASINNIINDDIVYEVRDAKIEGKDSQILYAVSKNPQKSNKGAKSAAEKADEIEIELI